MEQLTQAEALRQIVLDPENQPNQHGLQFLMHGPKMAFKIGARQFCLDYEPDEPGEFEFMRDALIAAFSIFTPDVKASQQAERAVPDNPWQRAVEIRISQGWKLKGDRIPVLYTDTINGDSVGRDDLWLCTTAALSTPVQQAAPAGDAELLELALAYKEYIDALPDGVVAALPAMPGIDGDWANEVLSRAAIASNQP